MNSTIPEQITYVAQMMFARRLTDIAGGNISVRDGETMYISPRYAGTHQHWSLSPDDIISGPIQGAELLEHPRFSREGRAHLEFYRHFPDVGSVIHAHSYNIQVFVAAQKPIPPVLEATQKFGVIDLVKYAPAHSQDLADNIVAGLMGKEERIRKQAAAVLIPTHGIIVAGKDLFSALDALERIDWNAWCIIGGRSLS
jgi:L-fuculose-phosphate aldolase